MRVLGIIAEYNPFHNGHRYQLEQAMSMAGADCSVAVMSGNFLQRGEPAMWDKRVRAAMAVENGVDLVMELPFAFACNNAEQFAYGGILLLEALGCVTDLSFGCEGEPRALLEAAELIAREDEAFKERLAAALASGMSFPAARSAALEALGRGEAAQLLSQPNNILAAEYLKQCLLQKSKMKVHPVRRRGPGYNSLELSGSFASATAIRDRWKQGEGLSGLEAFLPSESVSVLREAQRIPAASMEDFFLLIAARLRFAEPEELAQIWGVTEGMEHLLKKAVLPAAGFEGLIAGIKTKRYTRTRIQRTLMQILIGLTRKDFERIRAEGIICANVLGFSEKGKRLLSHVRKTGCAAAPIYSNLSRQRRANSKDQILLKYDLLASDLYHLALKEQIYANSDLVSAPYHKKY